MGAEMWKSHCPSQILKCSFFQTHFGFLPCTSDQLLDAQRCGGITTKYSYGVLQSSKK